MACLNISNRRSQIRYAAFLKLGTGHGFECLGWPCPTIFFFAFRDTNTDTLSPCAPKHVMGQRVFRGASVICMLVSRNVFHVVSVLQSIVSIPFLADEISCRSHDGSVYRMRSLAVCVTRSEMSVYSRSKWNLEMLVLEERGRVRRGIAPGTLLKFAVPL